MPDEGQTALGAPGNDLTKAWPDWQTAAAHGNLLSHLWAQRPGMNDLVPGYKADESGLLHVLDYASLPARFLTNALQGAVAGTADDIAKTWNAPPGSADRSMAAMKSLLDVGAGSSVVEAPAGALRTFGGVGAKTADLTALERAKTLELRRSSPEAIHAATSWYRDVDGEWKFEIPNDQGTLRVAPKLQFPAKVTQPDHVPGIQPAYKAPDGTDVGHTVPAVQPTVPGKPMKFTELGDIYDDPKLYAAYPDLAKTPVRHLADGPEGALYNPVSKTIYLGEHSDPADMQATLLHEIQHAVQMKEGFAWGSDPALHLPAGHREAAMKNNTEFSRLHTLAEQAGVPYESLWDSGLTNPTSAKPYFDKLDSVHGPSFSKDYQAALAEHLRLTGETKQAYRDYRRVAGEVEAENSAERWRTGMAGKGLPTETSGYRPEDQIVQRLMPDAADSTPAASFGGYKGANPVQRSQLYSALKMERMGLSPEEIHSQTQWYRDADGEWKFEIPNDQGQLRTTDSSIGRPERDAWRAGTAPHPGLEPMIKFEGSPQEYYGPMDHGMKVKDIYSDPKLFSAYPHLAEIPVRGLTFARAVRKAAPIVDQNNP